MSQIIISADESQALSNQAAGWTISHEMYLHGQSAGTGQTFLETLNPVSIMNSLQA